MGTRAFVISAVACLALGCGWLVGVSGDVSLAADAGESDDEPDGAERVLDAAREADAFLDTSNETDANADADDLEDSEPGGDASRLDAARDARDD
jgi:hypothetical protein